ncbi:MAG: (Fe-S)-binding protein [Actinobacteria bacterium]|nr:(Fe-S)-binding protein [Actinomycetota bacterium]
MALETAYEYLVEASASCDDCGICTPRCKVLDEVGVSIGTIGRELSDYLSALDHNPKSHEKFIEGVRSYVDEHPEILYLSQRCCMCSYCTASCPNDIYGRNMMIAMREILLECGVTNLQGFESTQVDKEWHIFSVYRAVYGISYSDLPHVEDVEPNQADTLFFPGCTLLSYAPALTRKVYQWLVDQGNTVVLSEECCGSPLLSAGLIERARSLKKRIAEEAAAAGIKKVVCACPSCMEELEYYERYFGDVEFIPLPRLLAEAGVRIDPTYFEVGEKIALFDSCHDRAQHFGASIRELFDDCETRELPHHGTDTLCCGSGGMVAHFDHPLSVCRVQTPLVEAVAVKADVLVNACPTCSYAFAGELRRESENIVGAPAPLNYLEAVFCEHIDWNEVYENLEEMWTGKYGAWVCQQLL